MMHTYQVQRNKKVEIKDFDPDDTSLWKDGKKEAKEKTRKLREELIALQRLLYAEQKHKLLIVIQAMDGGGKDGTIRSIFQGVNPQGVRVASFKVPTDVEMAHDYLWRVHKQTPKTGEITIFNRSHYEDILVVRVHQLVQEKIWKKRYEHIRNFEKLLIDEGTIILKFFLNISLDEQKERFLERIDMPEKQWKFNPRDIEERKLWGNYMEAYEEVLNKTSTSAAPWFVIPANRNWYRDYITISIIVDSLKKLKMKYPSPVEDIIQFRDAII